MRILLGLATLAFTLGAGIASAAPKPTAAQLKAHDYPTTERVQFVQDCMLDHPGSRYEMLTKCSCTIDSIARTTTIDDFVSMSTATKANSIGGEAGNTIRDTEVLQKEIKQFRELLSSAKKACFIESEPIKR